MYPIRYSCMKEVCISETTMVTGICHLNLSRARKLFGGTEIFAGY